MAKSTTINATSASSSSAMAASASTAASATVPATPPALPAIHDAAQQARNLRQVLQDDKLRLGCFLGAGCPLGVFDSTETKSIVLIPAVEELTKRVAAGLKATDDASRPTPAPTPPPTPTDFRKHWDEIHKECTSDKCLNPSVEDVLTEMRTLAHRRGKSDVSGITKQNLIDLDVEICRLILNEMKKELPKHRCSYNRFASWIGGINRLFPVDVFTPNYDLLFEQAFERHPQPHFDGFVGSREPFFDLASIEHDIIPARWVRLWKLHGSINWEKVDEERDGETITRVIRVTREAKADRVMIYPSHLKYEQSRRMPYLAMLDRLRAFFRAEVVKRRIEGDRREEDAPRLVICGYSFLDDHLNEVLLDGLRGNRNAHCFALMYSKLADYPRAVEYAAKQANLTVLARDGAVIGNRKGRYRAGVSGIDEHKPWLYEESVATSDPAKPEIHMRSHLGDFHYFALFLEQLCGGSGHDAPKPS